MSRSEDAKRAQKPSPRKNTTRAQTKNSGGGELRQKDANKPLGKKGASLYLPEKGCARWGTVTRLTKLQTKGNPEKSSFSDELSWGSAHGAGLARIDAKGLVRRRTLPAFLPEV